MKNNPLPSKQNRTCLANPILRRVAALAVLLSAANACAQVSSEFFAMHTHSQNNWPSSVGIQFSSWRSLSTTLKWSDINTGPGIYDWSPLDSWLATARQHGQSILYTVYYTPSWASPCPTCTCLAGGRRHDGGCYPPNDIDAGGGGTDQHLKDFVTALMDHVGPGGIQYLEIWNEPNIPEEYMGTIPQLVRMAQDVRSIAKRYDPNVEIISPPETGDGPGSSNMQFLAKFLAAGGGSYVDIIGMHGYVLNPEDIMVRIDAATAAMEQYGQGSKPIFVTEGSWANRGTQLPTDEQPGFSFRQYLSILSRPVQRFYLYAFDEAADGNLWSNQSLTPGGTAYQLYYAWLVGATMTKSCQGQVVATTPIWICGFTKPGGYKAAAIWDGRSPWGQQTTVNVPSEYVKYRDLYGGVNVIENHQVPVGYDPIWLEN